MVENLPEPETADRPTGILSEQDRKYLLDHPDSEIEPKSEQERNIRRRIRQKCKQAILDFSILFNQLENRDREQIFPSRIRDSQAPIWQGMVNGLAFLFYGDGRVFQDSVWQTLDSDLTVGGEHKQASEVEQSSSSDPIHWLVEQGITGAGNRDGYAMKDIDLDFTAEQMYPEQMTDRIKHGQDLSIEEMCYYLNRLEETGRCDTKELQEHLSSYLGQNLDAQSDES